MTTMAVAPQTDDVIGDMNGPLGYWGPTRATTVRTAPTMVPANRRLDADHSALDRLAQTVAGRTWAGTSRLMEAVLSQSVAAPRPSHLAAA